MTTCVFSPLSAVELTDGRVPRRLLNYGGLIDPISGKLAADPAAGAKALNARQFGRWLTVHDKFDVHLVVSLTRWHSHGITPLWCKCRLPEELARLLEVQFDGAQVEEGTGGRLDLCIPIRLAAGVERDRVVDDAVRQMRRITDELKDAPSG